MCCVRKKRIVQGREPLSSGILVEALELRQRRLPPELSLFATSGGIPASVSSDQLPQDRQPVRVRITLSRFRFHRSRSLGGAARECRLRAVAHGRFMKRPGAREFRRRGIRFTLEVHVRDGTH
jgi:hypothetical protein